MKKNLLSTLFVCLSCILFSQQPSMTFTNNTGTYTITCATPSINITASVIPSSGSITYTWMGLAASYSGSNVSITTGGIYTVTANNASISVASQTLMIRTNTYVPQASIVPNNNVSISCSSPTVNLYGSGTSGIPPASGFPISQPVVCSAFIGPSPGSSVNTCSYTAAIPGTYTFIVTDLNNGCSTSAFKAIFDNSVYPDVDLAAPPFNILCPNATATISPSVISNSQNLTYSWTPPQGAVTTALNTQYLIVNSPGNYKVIVINTITGCSVLATIQVVVCVGVSENTLSSIDIYPNPTQGKFYLQMKDSDTKTVQIYTSNGSLISEQDVIGKNAGVNISELNEGVYFIKVLAEGTASGYIKLIKLSSN